MRREHTAVSGIAIHLHPVDELVMEHYKFFPVVSYLIDKAHRDILIIGIHFAATLIERKENRLNT